jgi:hypothetical protein
VSVTDVAVTVTVAGLGIALGAVYVVAVPLAVVVAEKLPHDELPHVTVHFTPAFALSLTTFAVMLVVVDSGSEVGGAAANATVIPEDAAVIVIVAEAAFVVSVTDVAVTVTVAGFGTALGAV